MKGFERFGIVALRALEGIRADMDAYQSSQPTGAESMNEHTADPWAFWRQALAGNEDQPVSEDNPQFGFYRTREKTGPDRPVAIFQNDGEMVAIIGIEGKKRMVPAADRWSWVCSRPISHETYKAVCAGEPWPDTAQLPKGAAAAAEDDMKVIEQSGKIGDNQPPEVETLESFAERLADLKRSVENILTKGIKSQDDADNVANGKTSIGKLRRAADTARSDEKRPHDEASAAVQGKWMPVITDAKDIEDKAGKALAAFLAEEQKRLDREAAEKAEADRKEQMQKAADAPGAGAAIETPKPVAAKKAKAGGAIGNRIGVKKVFCAKITDYPTLLKHLANEPEVIAAVQVAANRLARKKVPVEGMDIIEDTTA